MSPTKNRLTQDMKDALKAGQKERLGVLRMLFTEVRNAEINDLKNPGKEKSEEEVAATITAYHKSLVKTLAEYPADRQQPLKDELKIVEEYMPRQLGADEVRTQIELVLKETEERNFGLLMKQMQQKLAGQVDGRMLSETLKAVLAKTAGG